MRTMPMNNNIDDMSAKYEKLSKLSSQFDIFLSHLSVIGSSLEAHPFNKIFEELKCDLETVYKRAHFSIEEAIKDNHIKEEYFTQDTKDSLAAILLVHQL